MAYRRYQGLELTIPLVIIIPNILLFIATTISPELVLDLGLQPAAFLERPWTIVTNLFVHGSLWHLFANMVTLFFFGGYLARLIGARDFFVLYFLGGIIGNGLYMLLASPFTIAIGASGAIFALGGALAVIRPNLRVFIFPIPVPIPLWAAVIGGFLIVSFFPYVAWQAHLGGLVLGLIAGYFLRRRQRLNF